MRIFSFAPDSADRDTAISGSSAPRPHMTPPIPTWGARASSEDGGRRYHTRSDYRLFRLRHAAFPAWKALNEILVCQQRHPFGDTERHRSFHAGPAASRSSSFQPGRLRTKKFIRFEGSASAKSASTRWTARASRIIGRSLSSMSTVSCGSLSTATAHRWCPAAITAVVVRNVTSDGGKKSERHRSWSFHERRPSACPSDSPGRLFLKGVRPYALIAAAGLAVYFKTCFSVLFTSMTITSSSTTPGFKFARQHSGGFSARTSSPAAPA